MLYHALYSAKIVMKVQNRHRYIHKLDTKTNTLGKTAFRSSSLLPMQQLTKSL